MVSTWSSGTGAAGIIGSLSYATLRSFDISNRNTMLIMLIFPFLEALAFWLLLRPVQPKLKFTYSKELVMKRLEEFSEKLKYVRELLKYMIPLVLVYLFEYFINQGLVRKIYNFSENQINKLFSLTFLVRISLLRCLLPGQTCSVSLA